MMRMPVAFAPHGGGPWAFVKLGWEDQPGYKAEHESLFRYLESVAQLPKTAPKAVLVISGHWEEYVPTVQTNPNPPLLYDYFGFPPEAYQIQWPAPGSPALATRVRTLLADAGFGTAEDAERGFDHGTFIPLKVIWPNAEITTIQLSLVGGLDPQTHLRLGRALAPLRDEGVFIVGSGMSYHNLREMFDRERAIPVAEAFDAWLREAMAKPAAGEDVDRRAFVVGECHRFPHAREGL